MRLRPAGIALAMVGVLAAGCGTSRPAADSPARWAPPAGAAFLATSLRTAAGTWAIAVMGGPAAAHDNFWQLFIRPAGSTRWKLVTPPGVADNGGLIVASAGGRSLITGFRPSQGLTYTPLSQTGDGGQSWSSAGPLDAALANTPDALAVAPASRQLLALTTSGTIQTAVPGYTRWHILTSRRALAATPAGGQCRLRALTAAAFTRAGTPLLGGACARPGLAGIFARHGETWQAAGPALPGRQHIAVLRLTATGTGLAALLQAGTGQAATLLAAWSPGGTPRWTISPPLQLRSAAPVSASFGPGRSAAVILPGRHGETITAGGQWRQLPQLPPGTATLTPGPGGQPDALAVHGTRLTVWQLDPGHAGWVKTQVISVPIQFGSSS
jgi:hypothetical protein